LPVVAPTDKALQFVKFELDLLKIYEDAGLEKTGLNLEVFNKAMVGYLKFNAGRQVYRIKKY
jgi:hypothetical protein